jgi:hypothetical protein
MKAWRGFVLAVIAAAVVSGCTSSKGPEPMPLCSDYRPDGSGVEDLPASRKQMRVALARAQEYSDLIYGSDCDVCAEVLRSEKGRINLHITSPRRDTDIATSARIEVQARDGKVLYKTQEHSCHARIERR